MGNEIVIPSMNNRYVNFLKKKKVIHSKESNCGSFFYTFDCRNENGGIQICKIFENVGHDESVMDIINYSKSYFDIFNDKKAILGQFLEFTIEEENSLYFLFREKKPFTLTGRVFQYPTFEDIEKRSIIYQIILAIGNLHSIGLVHGSINTDNIFLDWDNYVYIGDMAPYKPSSVRIDRSNYYHHYFSSSSRVHSYLAPEQLHGEDDTNFLYFKKEQFSYDYFALGCVIYYIYTSEHLFTFSTLIEKKNNNNAVDAKLNNVPEYIRPAVRDLLDNDILVREKSFNNLLRGEFFPLAFKQLIKQVLEFRGAKIGSHVLLHQILPLFHACIEGTSDETKLLLFPFLSSALLSCDSVDFVASFSIKFTDFFKCLDQRLLLTRILPIIIGLLNGYDNDAVRAYALKCIVTLMRSIEYVSDESEEILLNYLLPTLSKSKNMRNVKDSINFKHTLVETSVYLIAEFIRILPKQELIDGFVMIISGMCITDQDLVETFFQALNECSYLGWRMLSHFEIVIQALLNNKSSYIYDNILDTLILYCKGPQSHKFISEMVNLISSAAINNKITSEGYLLFLDWVSENNLLDLDQKEINDHLYTIFKQNDSKKKCIIRNIIDRESEISKINNFLRYIDDSDNDNDEQSGCTSCIFLSDKSWLSKNRVKYTSLSLSPKFYSSMRISNFPITSISIGYGNIFIGDLAGLVWLIDSQQNVSNKFGYGKPITDMKIIDDKLLLSQPGEIIIEHLNLNESSKIETPSYKILVMNSNEILTGKNDCNYYFDFRTSMQDPVWHFKLEGTTLSAYCSWSSDNAICVGTNEGVLTLFDVRMMSPIKSIIGPPVKSISPVCGPDFSVLVSSYTETQARSFFSDTKEEYPFGGFSSGFFGSSVIISDENVFLIDRVKGVKSVLFDDNKVRRLTDKEDDLDLTNLGNTPKRLHHHYSPITCFNFGNIFITGDERGFVNTWSIHQLN